jgi:SAM-dependent methyltransferase
MDKRAARRLAADASTEGSPALRFVARVRHALGRRRGPRIGDTPHALKEVNVRYVASLTARLPRERAMEQAIGGSFDQIGAIELGLLKHYGLAPDARLIDVGCGSGRLAKPLSGYLTGSYLGLDLVPDLIDHARRIAARPDWRFEVIDHIGIPEADGRADMVCFFSVLTHLLHEQSYWYLEEARRVLKPGGLVVFSFLEFAEPGHMDIFWATLQATKSGLDAPMNVFIERGAIQRWADALGLEIIEIRSGGDQVVPEGSLGQALCVLRKPG